MTGSGDAPVYAARALADRPVLRQQRESPEEIASERKRAVSTVRGQIRSLSAKTGTNRQADLIGLLPASPACFAAREHRDAIG